MVKRFNEVVNCEPGVTNEAAECTRLERSLSMHGDGQVVKVLRFLEDVMGAFAASDRKPEMFKGADSFRPGYDGQLRHLR